VREREKQAAPAVGPSGKSWRSGPMRGRSGGRPRCGSWAVGEGKKARAGKGGELAALTCGIGPRMGFAGPTQGKRRGVWAGLGLVWVLVVFFSYSISYLFSLLFPIQQTQLKPFEFKFKIEFSSSTQTNKTMHQHEL